MGSTKSCLEFNGNGTVVDDSGLKHQAPSTKLQAPSEESFKQQASSPKHKGSSFKPQASSSMIRDPS
jgi:hypothetical protein